ncbi:MAG: dihydrolipoyl dehydrogenase [Bdellovibrionales bacterium]|nr:dihydrolipoyl dehydrogenase [Bdellovibrionales bacterium]
MANTFDLVVIGAGPGGYVAAIRAAQLGYKTAIVEGHRMGGECLNYGCIPSKALISAGHTIDKIKHGDKMGITVTGMNVDLNKLIDWKASIVKQLTGGVGQLLKANGVTVFKGLGSFEGLSADGRMKKIKVDGNVDSYALEKSQGESASIEAERVIIATGSSVVQIPSMPFNGKTILGSREALEVRKIPKKIVVIGGGFIGLEIGTFYSKLGTEVTVVEATNTLLPGTDRDCVDVVQRKLTKNGVKILMGAKALGVQDGKSGGAVAQIEMNGKKENLECDWVLVTVGRKPRTGGLGLDKIGLKTTDRGFLEVNGRLETKVPGVYAIGDVIGGPMLAHKASKEGLVAVESFKNPGVVMDVRALPWAIFVDPEISTVGHSEESARAAGWDPVVGKCPFVANGRALTTGEAEGFVKIIADRKTDRILGAHMVGPDVSNLIQEVATVIEFGGTAADLGRIVHSHPTLPETVMEAAESVHGLAIHFFEKKPRGAAAVQGHA